jgi:hypothetical protein
LINLLEPDDYPFLKLVKAQINDLFHSVSEFLIIVKRAGDAKFDYDENMSGIENKTFDTTKEEN